MKAKAFPYQFHIHGLSDLQIGSESTSLSVIRQRIDEICSDPIDSGVLIAGDIEDEDRPSTRAIRKAAFSDRPEVPDRDAVKHMEWIDRHIVEMLVPLHKTKLGIMGVLAGHHYTQITPVINSVQYICNRLKEITGRPVPYLGEMSSFIDLRVRAPDGKSVRRIIHLQHGEGAGQTKGSSIQRLERTAQGFEADVYIRAHDCQLVAAKTDRLYPSRSQAGAHPDIMSKTITFVNLGAATRGYQITKGRPSYIEQGMLRPTTMGWATVKFFVRKAHNYEDPNQSYTIFTKVEL